MTLSRRDGPEKESLSRRPYIFGDAREARCRYPGVRDSRVPGASTVAALTADSSRLFRAVGTTHSSSARLTRMAYSSSPAGFGAVAPLVGCCQLLPSKL